MYFNSVKDYRDGQAIQTGMVIGFVTKDGEMRTTNSGKEVGSCSVKAYSKEDGSAAFLTVKGWGHLAQRLANVKKGDTILAAGRLDPREYNGKTYTDLVADFALVDSKEATVPNGVATIAQRAQAFNEIEDDGDLPF